MITIQGLQRAEEQNVRDYMEDRSFAEHLDKRYFAAFVFDGHNGSEASEFLVSSVPTLLRTLISETAHDADKIEKGVKTMFGLLNTVFRKAPSRKEGNAGSTICGLIVDKEAARILYVNCGDSGVVIYGPQGKNLFVSGPHGLETSEKRKAVTSRGGSVIKTSDGMWRLAGFINMARVFGDYDLGDLFEESIRLTNGRDVETKWISRITEGRKSMRVVLGTDGFFDEFSAETLAFNPILRAMQKPKKLLQYITACGVKGDNVTLITFEILIK